MLYELTIQNLVLSVLLFFLVQGILIIILKLLFKYFPKLHNRYLNAKDKVIKFEIKLSRQKLLLGILFLLVLVLTGGGIFWFQYSMSIPIIEDSYPKNGGALDTYTGAITIKFNIPVLKSKLNINSNYDLKGRWEWDKYFIFDDLTTVGRFYPEESLMPNQRVVIYIVGVSRALYDEDHEMGINFDTVAEAEVIASNPIDKSENNSRDSKISIELNKPNNQVSEWIITSDPVFEFEQKEELNFINIYPKQSLSQNQQYTMSITRRPIRYSFIENKIVEYGEQTYNHAIMFKTAREPAVEQFSPQGAAVRSNESIHIVFNDPIVQTTLNDRLVIEPNIAGTSTWDTDRIFVFKPNAELPKATKYTVRLMPGIQSMVNGVIEKEAKFDFETIGPVKIINNSPINNSVRVFEKNDITVTFDQEVDHESAQNHFAVDPGVGGRFEWDGNKMIFKVYGQTYNLGWTYTYKVLPGVKSIYGSDSVDNFQASFTIIPNEIVIGGVPQYFQPYGSFSCNIYAGKMALAYKGFNVDATTMISEMGHNESTYNGQWTGNPYVEYVGNSDGSWGYGAYWTAVQEVFNKRGISTQIKTGWSLSDLTKEIVNNHPVVIWRYNGESSDYDKDWTASDGTYIHGINGQHGGVVVGFRGSQENPSQILINDPWYGSFWADASYFDYTWSRLNRSALVIY